MSKSTTWQLKPNVKVGVRSFSSYPIQDYNIRIQWSDKLGLEHKHQFSTPEEAHALVEKIIAKGAIQTEHWTPHYYPKSRGSSEWITQSYAD
jgi:hypothetical protein